MYAFYHETVPSSPGIYCITLKATKKKTYVGSAVNLHKRRQDHFRDLQNNVHKNPRLQNAWNKYGPDAFTFEVLELVLTPDLLTAREQYWMHKLRPFFNILKIAGSQLGRKRTPATRARISAARRGRPGRKLSPEERENLRLSKLGNTYNCGKEKSPEHRQHIGHALLGNTNGLGKKRPTEAIEKTRIANLRHEVSQKTRDKLREANRSQMKTLILTSPDGTEYTVTGIQSFCREHSLCQGPLMKVANGKQCTHKGWTARYP